MAGMKKNSGSSSLPIRFLSVLLLLVASACELSGFIPTAGTARTPTRTATRTNTSTPAHTLQPSWTPRPSRTPQGPFHALTWDELAQFLANDHTNWNEYKDNYTCINFAIDLVNAAHAQNLKAWIVGVYFEGEELGHAFVAFETTDHGFVYIEPQGDNPYWVMEVGKPLCDAWGMYECFGTVEEFEYLQCDTPQSCVSYTP